MRVQLAGAGQAHQVGAVLLLLLLLPLLLLLRQLISAQREAWDVQQLIIQQVFPWRNCDGSDIGTFERPGRA